MLEFFWAFSLFYALTEFECNSAIMMKNEKKKNKTCLHKIEVCL